MGFVIGIVILFLQDFVFICMFYDVFCMGYEIEIQFCYFYDYDVLLICLMFEDVGVLCFGMLSGKIVKIDRN